MDRITLAWCTLGAFLAACFVYAINRLTRRSDPDGVVRGGLGRMWHRIGVVGHA